MLAHRVPPWVTIAVVAASGLVVAMQFTLIIPLLADLPELVGTSAENASWLVTATMLCSAVATPIVARMADMYGKRLMMIVALGVMIVGSVICALEVSFAMLITGRAMQGFAASLIAVGISILRDELPQDRVGTAVALMSATMGIGSALGLPLSGILYEQLGWHSIFWFSAVAGAVLVAALALLVDESPVRTPARFDLVGATLFSAALVTLLLPISKGNAWGWDSLAVWGLLAASITLFATWLPVQLRLNQPMVDVRLARQRTVLTTNIASLFVGFAMFSNLFLTTLVLQLPDHTGAGLGLNAGTAGLAMVPMGLVMVVLAPFTGRMLDRLGARTTLAIGSATMAAAYVARVLYSGSVLEVIVGSTLVGAGTAIAFAAMPTLIMGAVPITQTAAANGLSTLVRSIGAAVASTACAAILAMHTIELDDVPVPTETGVSIVLWLSAAAAFIATAVTFTIPTRGARATATPQRTGDAPESIVRGRLLLGGQADAHRYATVSALGLDGHQIDWNRVDVDGRFSLALPGTGTYLFTANAQGWRPDSRIIDVVVGTDLPDLRLDEELVLTGQVGCVDGPAAGSTVSLLRGEGELLTSVSSDADGRYRIPLPPAGPYIVTAFDPETRRSTATKLVVPVESVTLDLELN